MTLTSKTTIGIQSGILVAAVVVVFQVGRLSERAESRLAAIEKSVDKMKTAIESSDAVVNSMTRRLDATEKRATDNQTTVGEMKARTATIQTRVSALVECLKKGRRKCPAAE